MDRLELLRLVLAERFAQPVASAASRRTDDDLTTARRRRVLCAALADTARHTRKAAA